MHVEGFGVDVDEVTPELEAVILDDFFLVAHYV